MHEGTIIFVGRSTDNNGHQGYVNVPKEKVIIPQNTLTLGMVGTYKKAYYQIEPFTCSQNIAILKSVSKLYVYTALFISTVLNEIIKDVFPYMRSCTKKSINDLIIHLPQLKKGNLTGSGWKTI